MTQPSANTRASRQPVRRAPRLRVPRIGVIVPVLFSLLLGGTACGPWRSADAPAATVNGTTISFSDLRDEVLALADSSEFAGIYLRGASLDGISDKKSMPTGPMSALLNFRIRDQLVSEELKRRGLDLSNDDLTSAGNELEADLDRALADPSSGKVVAGTAKAVLSKLKPAERDVIVRRLAADIRLRRELAAADLAQVPGDAKAFFDANQRRYGTVCLNALVFGPDQVDKVEPARRSLAQGVSFKDVAASSGADAGQKGDGSVGCGDATKLSQSIRTALAAVGIGELIAPISTQEGGVALVAAASRQPANFSDVEAQVTQDQVEQRRATEEGPYRAFLASLDSRVSVDTRLGRWSVDDAQLLPVGAP